MGALAYFGGVSALVVPDNLKAAVIRAAFAIDDKSVLNRVNVTILGYRCGSRPLRVGLDVEVAH